jgi:PAS domain S-box-containing protein
MKSFFENNSTSDIMERIFQIGFEPVCIINEDGFILKANEAWKNAFGYTPEELENKNFLDFIYAGDTGMTEAMMESSRISIKDYQCINRLICKDGTSRFVEWRSAVYGNYVYIALRDITDYISHQKQIEEKENNFRMFFEAIDDLVFVTDEQGRIFHTNMVVNTKLGYSHDELLSMDIVDIYPEKHRAQAKGILADMIMGFRGQCTLPIQKKDGGHLSVETRLWFGTWHGKSCIYCISKDVTKQRAILEKYKKIFNTSPAFMTVNDSVTGQFIDVNSSFLKGLGYSREEVIGKTIEQLNLIPDHKQRDEIGKRFTDQKEISGVNLQLRHKNGEDVNVIFSGTEIKYQEHSGYLCVSVNI